MTKKTILLVTLLAEIASIEVVIAQVTQIDFGKDKGEKVIRLIEDGTPIWDLRAGITITEPGSIVEFRKFSRLAKLYNASSCMHQYTKRRENLGLATGVIPVVSGVANNVNSGEIYALLSFSHWITRPDVYYFSGRGTNINYSGWETKTTTHLFANDFMIPNESSINEKSQEWSFNWADDVIAKIESKTTKASYGTWDGWAYNLALANGKTALLYSFAKSFVGSLDRFNKKMKSHDLEPLSEEEFATLIYQLDRKKSFCEKRIAPSSAAIEEYALKEMTSRRHTKETLGTYFSSVSSYLRTQSNPEMMKLLRFVRSK